MCFETTAWAIKQTELNPTTNLVLIKLADFKNQETGQCNPSQKKLAALCNISVSRLNYHLSALIVKGMIVRERKTKANGAVLPSQYRFPLAPKKRP